MRKSTVSKALLLVVLAAVSIILAGRCEEFVLRNFMPFETPGLFIAHRLVSPSSPPHEFDAVGQSLIVQLTVDSVLLFFLFCGLFVLCSQLIRKFREST